MATNIMDLPTAVLGDISVRVTKASGIDALCLGMINNAFKEQYETQRVLGECNLENFPLYPVFEEPEEEEGYKRFMKKLRRMKNVDALYRKGVEHCFDSRRRIEKRIKGVDELTRAANKGSCKAQYIVGIVLVCVIRAREREGYMFLARLMRSSLSQTIDEVRVMRMTLRNHVIWRTDNVRELLGRYVHGPCECGDVASVTDTLYYLKTMEGDVEETPICLTCFWYRKIVLLLSNNLQGVDPRI